MKPLDEKTKNRLEKIRDLVLFRYGSTGTDSPSLSLLLSPPLSSPLLFLTVFLCHTGVQQAIKKAVDCRNLVPVYPVRNLHNFTCDGYVLDCCCCYCWRCSVRSLLVWSMCSLLLFNVQHKRSFSRLYALISWYYCKRACRVRSCCSLSPCVSCLLLLSD